MYQKYGMSQIVQKLRDGYGHCFCYVCIQDQNPCPWLVFDIIVKILKNEQKYYITKNEHKNNLQCF